MEHVGLLTAALKRISTIYSKRTASLFHLVTCQEIVCNKRYDPDWIIRWEDGFAVRAVHYKSQIQGSWVRATVMTTP